MKTALSLTLQVTECQLHSVAKLPIYIGFSTKAVL